MHGLQRIPDDQIAPSVGVAVDELLLQDMIFQRFDEALLAVASSAAQVDLGTADVLSQH